MIPVGRIWQILFAGAWGGLLLGCHREATDSQPAGGANRSQVSWFSELPLGTSSSLRQDTSTDERYFMPDIMGSGGALLDFDGDGLLDVLLIGGRWTHGGQPPQMRTQLFRQHADGMFVDVSQAAGLAEMPGYGVGVAAGDIDNDGDTDLYIAGFGGDRLLVNQGDGTFTDGTLTLDSINQRWGTAAAFFDYDCDGWLDLCVVTYLDYFPGTRCDDDSGRQDFCGPNSFSGTVTRLYRNLGGQNARGLSFSDMTIAAGLADRSGPGLGVCCRDFDGDGRPDIFVANDMQPNSLWMQQADGSFHEEGALRGVAFDRFGKAEASMGVACGDFDGDGLDDLFITTLRAEMNVLFLGRPGALFSDQTAGSGLGPPSLEYTGFGAVSLDLENDGDLDLVVINGRVRRAAPLTTACLDPFWNDYAEPNQIFLNDGQGHFAEASQSGGPLTSRDDVFRALVYGDVDNDGDFDLLVTSCAGPARLYRNDCPRQGSWLMVRAIDPALNRDAFGARIEVTAGGRQFHREVNPSSSYLASNDVRVHFGLGNVERYDRLMVRWPDGLSEEFPAGEVNRHLILFRGRGTTRSEAQPP